MTTTELLALFRAAYRDYVTDGVPGTGSHEPIKLEIRDAFASMITFIEGLITSSGSGALVFATKAAMDASLAHAANIQAWVLTDATAANNGIYKKLLGSGLGSWEKQSDFSFQPAVDTAEAAAIAAVVSQQATSIAAVAAAVIGTSTTSVAIGTGSKSFTTQAGKPFAVGQRLRVANDGANWMEGPVSAYDSGTGALDLTVDVVGGTGTFAAWNIVTAGNPGVQGIQGDVSVAQLHGTITYQTGLRNIFDKSTVGTGLLKTNQTADAGSTWRYSAYMPVIPSGTITFSHTSTASSPTYGVHFYTLAGAFVSSASAPTANTPISVPATAHYARFTMKDFQIDYMMVVQGSTLPSDYIPYGIPTVSARHTQITNIARALRRSGENVFTATDRTSGNQVDSTTGALSTAVGNNNASTYLPVNGLTNVTMGEASYVTVSSPYGIAFFDANKTYISGVAAPWTAGQVIAVPAGAYYMRVTVHNIQLTTFYILEGSVSPGFRIAAQPAFVADTRPWHGHSVVLQGDSLFTNDWNWYDEVFAYHGLTLAKNASRGGRFWVAGKMLYDADDTTPLVSGDFTGVDLCIVGAGTNDAASALGTSADAAGDATVCGQAKLFIETVLGWNKYTRLVVATPHGRQADFVSYRPIAVALREVAALYGCPVLDFNAMGGLNSVTASTFLADGTHPNTAGKLACWTNPAKGFLHTIFPMT